MSNIKSEAFVQECSKRKFFLKISSELTKKEKCARISFIVKVQLISAKRLRSNYTRHRYFPVKFVKFLRSPLRTPTILQNICEQLLL